MGTRFERLPAVTLLAMLPLLAQAAQDTPHDTRIADGYAYLSGFGEGDGCDDPIVLGFRGKILTQVAWPWESCND